MQTRHLTPEQLAQWKADGFLILRAHELFSDQEVTSLLNWTKEVQEWPETPGKWMKYFEKSLKDGTRILNRVEKFLDFHEGLRRVFYEGKVPAIVSELCEEPVVLYKEKINFKLPGGEGFKPHQDHAAGWWRYGHQYHISMLVTIDAADLENGCLELVRGEHTKGLFGKEYEEIPEEYVKKFKWEAAEMKPGDVAFFDSYVPHRSGPNMTDRPRRSMYITYGKAKDGDWRDKYYEDKRKSFPPDIERESGKEYKYKI